MQPSFILVILIKLIIVIVPLNTFPSKEKTMEAYEQNIDNNNLEQRGLDEIIKIMR